MSKPRYKAQDFIDIMPGTLGIISEIAKRVGCDRSTVYRFINDYSTVKQALYDEREKTKDFTESKLLQQISSGNMTAIIFYLKTQAKERGYVERQEITGKDGDSLEIRVTYADD